MFIPFLCIRVTMTPTKDKANIENTEINWIIPRYEAETNEGGIKKGEKTKPHQ